MNSPGLHLPPPGPLDLTNLSDSWITRSHSTGSFSPELTTWIEKMLKVIALTSFVTVNKTKQGLPSYSFCLGKEEDLKSLRAITAKALSSLPMCYRAKTSYTISANNRFVVDMTFSQATEFKPSLSPTKVLRSAPPVLGMAATAFPFPEPLLDQTPKS